MNNLTGKQVKPEFNTDVDAQEELSLMMSLALDGLLDEEDETRFYTALEQDARLADEWADWQHIDQLFADTPDALPPFRSTIGSLGNSVGRSLSGSMAGTSSGFVQEFERRLLQQSQRHHLWQIMFVGMTIALLWGGLIAGVVSMGTYLFNNQGVWVGEVMQSLTYWFAVTGQWIDAFSMSFSTTMSSIQMVGIGLAYVVLATMMLWAWVRVLRRSAVLSSPVYSR